MSVRVSLRGMLRLIRVDTLRSVYNVGFLAERLKCRSVNFTSLLDVFKADAFSKKHQLKAKFLVLLLNSFCIQTHM